MCLLLHSFVVVATFCLTVSMSHARNAESTTSFAISTDDFTIKINKNNCLSNLIVNSEDGVQKMSAAIPFLHLYNRVSDNRQTNMAPCSRIEQHDDDVLEVFAAFPQYGSILVELEPVNSPPRIYITIKSTTNWTGDPVQKHIQLGEFWTGILENTTTPYVMGALQGPIAPPTSNLDSAGFLTCTSNSYFKYFFFAEPGDKVAFTYLPSKYRISDAWNAVATDINMEPKSENRFLTWLWSSSDFGEQTREAYAELANQLGVDMIQASGWDTDYLTVSKQKFPSGLPATTSYLSSQGLRLGFHMHPDIVWPCANTTELTCLTTGIGGSPVAVECPECLVPEGLAPTYRSGDLVDLNSNPTEDIGFWWCHEKTGNIAHNGNAKPCGQGSCNSRDWNMTWGQNMTLINTEWSALGAYRNGGAVLFSGDPESYGIVDYVDEFSTIRSGLTVGMVIHPVLKEAHEGAGTVSCLMCKNGSFSLDLKSDQHISWSVELGNQNSCTVSSKAQVTSTTIVKATYNSTSSCLKLFLNNILDGVCCNTETAIIMQRKSPIVVGSRFSGAVEEIYVKNVSTENRVAYMYADDNRFLGTYLIDLSSQKGRDLFAKTISDAVNQAPIAAVQYDGFEKLQLIAGRDFEHSNKTFTSGLWRGLPTPDWYHYEGWPLFWGQGVLKGIIAAHDMMSDHSVAVECSFMAPGLGPWRPDMAPYVDERGDFVQLGLEWHPKILYRIELTGTVINSYDTNIGHLDSTFEVDYWIGGLVTGGLPLQPIGSTADIGGKHNARIKWWINRYRKFGHVEEGGVNTLYFDSACCHVQGDCEWVPCDDIVFVTLSNGSVAPAPTFGLYAGSSRHVNIPPIPDESTILIFQSLAANTVALTVGSDSDQKLSLVLHSPTNSSGITMSQGFWSGHEEVQEVVMNSDGKIISSVKILPTTKYTYHPQLPADPGETVTFTKAQDSV